MHHVFYASILKKADAAGEWAGSKLSVGNRVEFKVEAFSHIVNRIIITGVCDDIVVHGGRREETCVEVS